MKRIVAIYLFTILSGIASAACEKSYTIHSPDRTIGITLTVGNRIAYEVRVDGRTVVAPTPVAMTLDDGTVWGGSAQPSRIRKGMVNTSFATPFVTGASALLMEWGIVKGNDPYLYGEKVKAYLRRGARQIPGYERWPNGKLGYGEDVIIRLH